MKNISDQELVDLYKKNKNMDAFAEVYERNVAYVYRYAFSRLGNRNLAEDVTAETFESLLILLPKYSGKSSLRTFIVGIALNKIRQSWSSIKKESVSMEFDENHYQEEEQVSDEYLKKQDELSKIMRKVLDSMTDRYMKVLKMLYIDIFTRDEVCEKLGISEENLRVLNHRALKQAKKLAIDIKNKKHE